MVCYAKNRQKHPAQVSFLEQSLYIWFVETYIYGFVKSCIYAISLLYCVTQSVILCSTKMKIQSILYKSRRAMFFITNRFSRKERNLPSAFFYFVLQKANREEKVFMEFKKIKHIRSSATGYRAKAAESFYGTDEAKFFFESPYRDNYDGYQEGDDFVPDKIVDRFGRTILSLS